MPSNPESLHQGAEKTNSNLIGESSLETSSPGQLKTAPPFQLMAGDMPPVQRKASSGGLPGDMVNGFAASTGHDLSDVNVHYNSAAPSQVGALAYAQGNDIHLGAGQEQHLAHEAAHVVQQREGRVQANTSVGGMPVNDNAGLESEADSMGSKAMQMKAAPAAQLQSAGGSVSRGIAQRVAAVQRKPIGNVAQMKIVHSHFGDFEDKTYSAIGDVGVNFEVEFRPNTAKMGSTTKAGLLQSVRSSLGGTSVAIHPTLRERMVGAGQTGEGHQIDRISSHGNPMYAANQPAPTDNLGDTATNATWGQHATKKADGTWNPGKLKDTPALPGRGADSAQEFETAALGLDGSLNNQYLGSVKWGWRFTGGKFNLIDFDIVSMGVPSATFLNAARQWNASHTEGTYEARGAGAGGNAQVYKTDHSADFTVSNGTAVTLVNDATYFTHIHNNEVYAGVQVMVGTTAKQGLMKMTEVNDKRDGGQTIDLPLHTIFVNPATTGFYSDPQMTTKIKDLPANSRMENTSCTIHNSYGMKLVDGPDYGSTGYVRFSDIRRE